MSQCSTSTLYLYTSFILNVIKHFSKIRKKQIRFGRCSLFLLSLLTFECAKFRGSRAIVGLVGLVPSCHRAFVSLEIFLVGIS